MMMWRRLFHAQARLHQPRTKGGLSAPRFGKYERIVPASLATVLPQTVLRPVPGTIAQPPYAADGSSSPWDGTFSILATDEDKNKMRKVNQLARDILLMGGQLCLPGITTDKIDEAIHKATVDRGAYPSPLNYSGFPKSVCTSINNIMAHGIPDGRPLRDGDIINIDVSVYLDGFHGDTSATFLVGDVDEAGKALVECTRESLEKAIAICGPGVPFKEIGRVISDLAHSRGFSVSDELSGHGIGRHFHCLPLILHHVNDEPGDMQPGMAFTIEPILCQGTAIGAKWPDDWTITTADGGRSAQFEHTILITEDGQETLTR